MRLPKGFRDLDISAGLGIILLPASQVRSKEGNAQWFWRPAGLHNHWSGLIPFPHYSVEQGEEPPNNFGDLQFSIATGLIALILCTSQLSGGDMGLPKGYGVL